jgi:hypothetical protein
LNTTPKAKNDESKWASVSELLLPGKDGRIEPNIILVFELKIL